MMSGKSLGLNRITAFSICVAIALLAPVSESGGETDRDEDARITDTGPALPPQNAEQPRWHFRVADPADLTGEDAEEIYARLRENLAARYRLSFRSAAADYQGWDRVNTAPYRSMTHGQRFVNNFANAVARNYRKYEQAGILPVGSIVAKDSFAVTEDGDVLPGPLFLMQKMESGFSGASGDWQYTMILPDGSLYGTTNGDGHERVEFCIACHLAVEHHDHLYFVPDEFRVR